MFQSGKWAVAAFLLTLSTTGLIVQAQRGFSDGIPETAAIEDMRIFETYIGRFRSED
jgi:hypothetical protein